MHYPIPPANNGTIDITGDERGESVVVANSAAALTWLLPTVTAAMPIGGTIGVTNILGGAITVRDPGNTTTLGVVAAGTISSFILAGSGVWSAE